jgi:hypothetical protein
VVDQVVHHEAADGADPGHREDLLAPLPQRPGHQQLRIGLRGQGRSCRGPPAVESLQDPVARLGLPESRLVSQAVELERRLLQRDAAPDRQVGDVRRKLAERHRLRMRLPPKRVRRHALEHPAGGRHLVIELGQQGVGDGHGRRTSYAHATQGEP